MNDGIYDILLSDPWLSVRPEIYFCCKALYRKWGDAQAKVIRTLIEEHHRASMSTADHQFMNSWGLRVEWAGVTLWRTNHLIRHEYRPCTKGWCKNASCRMFSIQHRGHQVILYKHDRINRLRFTLTLTGLDSEVVYGEIIKQALNLSFHDAWPRSVELCIDGRSSTTQDYDFNYQPIYSTQIRASIMRSGSYVIDGGTWIEPSHSTCTLGKTMERRLDCRIVNILMYMRTTTADFSRYLIADWVAALRRP